jgi:predicted  nucleic acid-binding Zn-ribbon protein
MRPLRFLLPCLVLFAACDTKAKEQLATLAHADSLRTDSLVAIKNDLLNEVMTSTQFVNDINSQIAALKFASVNNKLNTKTASESDLSKMKEDRTIIVSKIRELVARLDTSENRLVSLRKRANSLAKHDSTLVAQVAAYEQNINELRKTVEGQKAEFQGIIDRQNTQIAELTSKVDTVTHENVRLAGERTALVDTVSQLTTEKNTAYYVVGSTEELVKKGILVEEGRRRFLFLGGRPVHLSRELDPSKFTQIDRLKDRVINFPDAKPYTIFTRQNPAFASPLAQKDGKLAGGLRIDQPEKFWETSKFLIIVKS